MVFYGQSVRSWLDVTEQSALGLSAVYSCVRIISESLAALPLVTYRNTRDGRRRATDLPIYEILHDQADENLSAFMLIETIVLMPVLMETGMPTFPVTELAR